MFLYQIGHAATSDDPRLLRGHKWCNTFKGFLYHTLPAGQWQKLFRKAWCAQGPKASTAASSQDNGVEVLHDEIRLLMQNHLTYSEYFLVKIIHVRHEREEKQVWAVSSIRLRILQ